MRIAPFVFILCWSWLSGQTVVTPLGRPEIFLTVSATKTNATIILSAPGERDMANWRRLLAASVACERLTTKGEEDDPEERSTAATVYCVSIPRKGAGRTLQIHLHRMREELEGAGVRTVYLYVVAPTGSADLHGVALRTWTRGSSATLTGTVPVRQLPDSLDIRIAQPTWKLPALLSALGCLFGLALLASAYSSMKARQESGSAAERWFLMYVCIFLRGMGVWLGLWTLCTVFGGVELLRDAWNLQSRFADLLVISVLVAAGTLVNVACAAIEGPRYRDVRKLPIGVGEIVRLELLKDACVAFVALAFAAIDSLPMQSFATAVLPLFIILVPVTLAARLMQKTIGIRPFAASHGELRDAVFQLASRGGVALKNLYVLPSTKWKLVNAFASRGNTVMLSQALVEALSKREVDALAAHELTHVKETHLRKIGLRSGLLIAPLMIVGAGLTVFYWPDQPLGFVPFAVLVLWLVSPTVRRRYEWQADAGAAALTRDPEAVITGLVRITRLNCMPLGFSRPWCWLMSHPSTIRRVQAIARGWNIPQDRVAALVNIELQHNEERYSIEQTETSDARVFTTEYKSRTGLAILATTVTVLVAGPLCVSSLASRGFSLPLRIAIDCAGVFAIALLDYMVLALISGLQNRKLATRVRRKLEREGSLRPDVEATFVSLTPSSSLRLYEGRYEWDVGYLWFEDNRLVYRGELAHFDVGPAHVAYVRLPHAPIGLPAARRLYIGLNCGTAGEVRMVGVRPLGHLTPKQGRTAVQSLHSRVAAWLTGSIQAHREPASVDVPHESAVTSQSPKSVATAMTRGTVVFGGIAMAIAGMLPYPSPEVFLLIAGVILVTQCVRVRPLRRYRDEDVRAGEPAIAHRTAAP